MKPLVSKLRGNNKITDDLFYMEKRAETSVILIVLDGVLCEVYAYTVTVLCTVAQHGSGTSESILSSVTVYKKLVSCQCNLTPQIEEVQ